MNAAGILCLILGAVNVIAAALVLASAPRRALHRFGALLGLAMAGWSGVWLLLSAIEIVPFAAIFGRVACVAVAFLPVAWLHYLHLALEGGPKRRFSRAYAVSAVAAAAALTPAFGLVEPFFSPVGKARSFDFELLFGLALAALGGVSIVSLARAARAVRPASPELRRRARALCAISGFVAVAGLNDLLPLFGVGHYPLSATRVSALGLWVPAAYVALVVYGVASDQLIELRIALGRWLAAFPRSAFFLTVCALALLLVNAWHPQLLPAPATFVCLAVVLFGHVATGLFSPRSLTHHADRLRSRVYGGRFAYLEKVRALAAVVHRQADLAVGLDLVCRGLRENLGVDFVEVWYRDANGEPRVAPPRPGLNDINRLSRWDDVVREARRWRDREDLWVIPLQTGGAEPVGYIRLVAGGRRLRLNELDREAIVELAAAILHQLEREVIRVSLDLRQVNEAKDRFLAGINHEVRNPLNGITGLLHLLRQEGLRGRPAYLIETLNTCAEQLVATMDNALDFASLTQGRAVARATRFELGALVRGSVAHHALGAAERIQLHLPSEDHWLLGDAGKLRQIISNYVGNALKYGQPPRAELRTRLRAINQDKLELRVEVLSPSAIALDDELGEWFRPFRRGRRASETGAPGSGLGLAISQRLAEAMEGSVGVGREAEQLVFWLAVPVVEVAPPDAPAPAPARIDAVADRAFHVLAVEDEAYNRLILGHHLVGWGLETDWAGSGAEAEEKIRERRPDLVIMDWLLGDTDGATLLPRLLAAHADDPPPIIVLSAYATEEKESQALAVGARRFLSKPLRPDVLWGAVRDAIPGLAEAGPKAPSLSDFPVDRARIEEGLREEWQAVQALWRTQPAEAANHVHRMRGLARYLPPSELQAALREIERALADGHENERGGVGVEEVAAAIKRLNASGALRESAR